MEQESYTILVVDDEEPLRRLLQKELASDNREVLVAGEAWEVKEMLCNNWFDVIILDLRLPGVTDLELLVEVKNLVPHVEVVMISGHAGIDTAAQAMKLGAFDFIQKPFNLEHLDVVVEKAHQRALLSR